MRILKKKSESVSQLVAPIARKTTNEIKKTQSQILRDDKVRSYDTRFIPRYSFVPQIPEGLAEPTFSESSTKILRERYLLKDEN